MKNIHVSANLCNKKHEIGYLQKLVGNKVERRGYGERVPRLKHHVRTGPQSTVNQAAQNIAPY